MCWWSFWREQHADHTLGIFWMLLGAFLKCLSPLPGDRSPISIIKIFRWIKLLQSRALESCNHNAWRMHSSLRDIEVLISHSMQTSAKEMIGFQRPPTRNSWYERECLNATASKDATHRRTLQCAPTTVALVFLQLHNGWITGGSRVPECSCSDYSCIVFINFNGLNEFFFLSFFKIWIYHAVLNIIS